MRKSIFLKGLCIILTFGVALSADSGYVWAIARLDGGGYGPGVEGDPNTYQDGGNGFMRGTLSAPLMQPAVPGNQERNQGVVDQKNATEQNYIFIAPGPPPDSIIDIPSPESPSDEGLNAANPVGDGKPAPERRFRRPPVFPLPNMDPSMVQPRKIERPKIQIPKPKFDLSNYVGKLEKRNGEGDSAKDVGIPKIERPKIELPRISPPTLNHPFAKRNSKNEPTVIELLSKEDAAAMWAYVELMSLLQGSSDVGAYKTDKVVRYSQDESDYTIRITEYHLTRIGDALKGDLPEKIILKHSRKVYNGRVELGISTGDGDPSLQEGKEYVIPFDRDKTGKLTVYNYPGVIRGIEDRALYEDLIKLDSIKNPEAKIRASIEALVGDSREEMREGAAVILGQIGKPAIKAVPPLINHLDDVTYSDYDTKHLYPRFIVPWAVLRALIKITDQNFEKGVDLRTIDGWRELKRLYLEWWNNQ